MFSSGVHSSARQGEGGFPGAQERLVGSTSQSIEAVDPVASLAGSYFSENPFAPPALGPDENVRRSLQERAVAWMQEYISSLIEGAQDTSTSKFLVAFALCQGATAAVVSKAYYHVVADWPSIDEHPQSLLIGCMLSAAFLHSGFQCGVVLVHRVWTGWFKRPES